jgi:hypothetical protein
MEREPNRRPAIPEPVALAVMVANRHTCCICREDGKHVIFHHTDHNRANNDPANLAVLCHDCHSRVEGNEGLGRRFTTAEVREYKKQWEIQCSRIGTVEEDSEEPLPIISEALLIGPDEHVAYDLTEMEEGDEIEVTVSADRHIDASICTEADYKRWLRGKDLKEFEGIEDARRFTLPFTVPEDGDYLLLLINYQDREFDVEVEALVWQ